MASPGKICAWSKQSCDPRDFDHVPRLLNGGQQVVREHADSPRDVDPEQRDAIRVAARERLILAFLS